MKRIKGVFLLEQGRIQAWLADQIDKNYVVITNCFYNNAQPSLSILNKIAEVLNIDIRKLIVPLK